MFGKSYSIKILYIHNSTHHGGLSSKKRKIAQTIFLFFYYFQLYIALFHLRRQNVSLDRDQKECRQGAKNTCRQPQTLGADENPDHPRNRRKTPENIGAFCVRNACRKNAVVQVCFVGAKGVISVQKTPCNRAGKIDNRICKNKERSKG